MDFILFRREVWVLISLLASEICPSMPHINSLVLESKSAVILLFADVGGANVLVVLCADDIRLLEFVYFFSTFKMLIPDSLKRLRWGQLSTNLSMVGSGAWALAY